MNRSSWSLPAFPFLFLFLPLPPSAVSGEASWPKSPACRSKAIEQLEKEEIRAEEEGRLDTAIAKAKEILKLCPGDAHTLNVLAGLFGMAGNHGEQLGWANQAIAGNPRFWQAHINRGNALMGTGDLKGAERAYKEAEKLAPEAAIPAYSLGLVEEARKNFPAALAHYDRSVKLDPAFESGHFNRAAALANLGRKAEAKGALQRVLQLNPKADDARAMLRHLER